MAIFLFVTLCSISVLSYPYVWPMPKVMTTNPGGSTLNITSFTYTLFDEKTQQYVDIGKDAFLKSAVDRYEKWITPSQPWRSGGTNVKFDMKVKDISQRELTLETIEDYMLDITNNGIALAADTIQGLLYGLETVTQLVEETSSGFIKDLPIHVEDSPRYKWRGLMIDVSRHYINIEVVKRVIDGMSYNKLNSMHLHIVDDQAWPPVIEKYPLLSQLGAYSKTAIYTQQQLKDLNQYAYERNVRIIPEMDIPGHSRAFGLGYPKIVANCPSYGYNTLNPIEPETKEVVNDVVAEFGELFTDAYFHFGGDELNFQCWNQDKTIDQYMKDHSLSGPDLESIFMDDIFKATEKISMGWSDRFVQDAKVTPPANSVAEIWRGLGDLNKIGALGYKMINAAGWYLDQMCPLGKTHYMLLDNWLDMYALELDDHVDEKYRDLLIGGEGCQWAEQVNDFSILPRIFPRACSFSERLWSPKSVNIDPNDENSLDDVTTRLNFHACHNHIQRGIRSGPLRPNYCPHDFDL